MITSRIAACQAYLRLIISHSLVLLGTSLRWAIDTARKPFATRLDNLRQKTYNTVS